MKRVAKVIIPLFAFLTFSCNLIFDDGYNEYRKIAWDYINGESDKTILGDWYDGKVDSEAIYSATQDTSISVTWNTTEDDLLGPITVYIQLDKKKVLGCDPRL
jgi:hypothetical protein